jgi:hypothetical protein
VAVSPVAWDLAAEKAWDLVAVNPVAWDLAVDSLVVEKAWDLVAVNPADNPVVSLAAHLP